MAEAAQPLELVLGVLTESDMTSIEQEFSKPLVKVCGMRDPGDTGDPPGRVRLLSCDTAAMTTTTDAYLPPLFSSPTTHRPTV